MPNPLIHSVIHSYKGLVGIFYLITSLLVYIGPVQSLHRFIYYLQSLLSIVLPINYTDQGEIPVIKFSLPTPGNSGNCTLHQVMGRKYLEPTKLSTQDKSFVGMILNCFGLPRRKINVAKRFQRKMLRETQDLVWISNPPMSKDEVDRLRDVYWMIKTEDPVEGKIWQTLKCIVAAIRNNDMAEAQMIADNSELFFPNGDLDYVLDYSGIMYNIPKYTLAYPVNTIDYPATTTTANESPNSGKGRGLH